MNLPISVPRALGSAIATAASISRAGVRGIAMPLLLDLVRKPNFLHDNSVPTMENLLNPSRGATAPHPFYFPDAAQRAEWNFCAVWIPTAGNKL